MERGEETPTGLIQFLSRRVSFSCRIHQKLSHTDLAVSYAEQTMQNENMGGKSKKPGNLGAGRSPGWVCLKNSETR